MVQALALTIATFLGQSMPVSPGVHDQTLPLRGSGALTYSVAVPRGYSVERPAPLILVLHSGGERFPHYGREFMKLLVQPALAELGGILVAPDCPTQSWTDPPSEQAVMALTAHLMENYAIDRTRVLVTGFSMGGRGTWFMASRHADVFTAAIPMAASTRGASIEQLGTIPTYVIHSRDDEVVPFAPEERMAKQLAEMGRPVRFEGLWQLTHFEMFRYVDALRRGGRWIAQRWNERR